MKRLTGAIFLLLLTLKSFGITVTVNAVGATGSFKTGYTQATTGRTDGNMVIDATGTPKRGWAVFDLAGVVPVGAVVSAVNVRFNYTTSTMATGVACELHGYVGDLSTVTVPATLFAACATGAAFNTTNWGASTTGTQVTRPFNATGNTFIETNAGAKVSIGWVTTSGANVYTIIGEGGTAATQPQLQITYTCSGVSGVTATAAPNPVCAGSTLSLSGTGTGTTSYAWAGPGSFTSTNQNATLTATAASAGVYTLTAYTASGCGTPVTTAAVVVNPQPAAITPAAATVLCIGGTAALADATTGGTWTSNPIAIATISTSGVVTGVSPGTALISYTLSATGCRITKPVTVNGAPGTISPASVRVCIGAITTLTNSSGAGTWTSSAGGTATIGATSGIISGLTAGTATITFSNGCGTPTTRIVTVDPLPAAIAGPTGVCPGASITLTSATAGGTWASTPPATATTISSTQGLITGVTPGIATITYTSASPQSCRITTDVTVSLPPGPITGTMRHCVGTAVSLTNALPGGTWSSATPFVATANASSGVITGLNAGTTVITYATACGYSTRVDTVVGTPPLPFVGNDTVCQGDTLVLANSVIGGTWSSSNTAVATILPGSGIVYGLSLGYTLISYTVSPGCIARDTVFVVGPPPAITGTMQTCPGRTTVLSNASSGGTWMSVAPAIAVVGMTSGVVTGVSASTAVIVYRDSRGCRTYAEVTVNPLPLPIFGDSVICESLGDTLYDLTTGGVWTTLTPGIATIGSATGILTSVNDGIATIRYTLPATGCYINKQLTVNAQPAPIVTYNFATRTFIAPAGYASYQWYNSVNGLLVGATTPSTSALLNASYYVVVTDTIGCAGESAHIPFNVTMLGINGTSSGFCRIYPNPAANILNVETAFKVKAVITDLAGRTELVQEDAKKINIETLNSGLHFISLYGEDGAKLLTEKLLKE
ncbi:MAG: T9SS type A sorting domain-containing protein [Bacteroidota bacterium]